MKNIYVTAAVIKSDGKILIAKRKKSLCGKPAWEFPGGKIEKNESRERCLKREIFEELNLNINVGKLIAESQHKLSDKIIYLSAFDCEIISGEIKSFDHEEIIFVQPEELLNYDLMPADIPIAKKIISERTNDSK